MNEVKTFTQGGLNYDTEVHLMPATDWIDALNVRISASGEQLQASAYNIEGNVRIGNYDYAAGVNKCIGAFADELRNVVYAFIANSNHQDQIIEINPETGVITPILINELWTGLNDVLAFEHRYKIHSINIIHRADDEGDLMFWTDGNTAPRKINIRRAKLWGQTGGYPNPITYDHTTVVKKPPRSVDSVWGSDLDRFVNNTRGKLFQAQVRFVYDDYEKSVWSSWGNYSLPIIPFTADRDSDPTINNYIDFTFDTGSDLVTKIEFGVRQNIEGNWGELFLIKTFDKEEDSISNNSTYTYRFYNDTAGTLQLAEETGQLFDYVPIKAGCQSIVGGDTIAYADITEGISFDGPLDVFMSNEESELFPLAEGENVNGYKHSAKYKFGLVYFDEYNRTDGVHNDQPVAINRRFEVNTTFYLSDNLTDDNYNIFIPKISASIFHRPPVWAKTYKWVRTKCLSITKYFYYIVRPVATEDLAYLYIWLEQITDSFPYDGNTALSYEFVPGDRIRFMRRMSANASGFPTPGAANMNIDLEIHSVLKDPEIGSEKFTGSFIKIKKSTLSAGFLDVPYLAEIYTPSNIINADFYYEFGREYQILNAGTPSRRHAGMNQDQTINLSQPATFTFMTDGDVYYRRRINMDILAYGRSVSDGLIGFKNIPISDFNYSDKYISSVNGNGRAYVVDDNAKEQRLPHIIRFGGAYIQDTFINKTNNFPPINIVDSCDRSFGAIRRLLVRDRQLRVFQELKCGWLPIRQQVLQTANDNNLISQSDKLLNDIQYYLGDFGIGNAPCSLASKNFADYFHDTNRGVICRLSNDGVTPISITARINRFAVTEDVKYKAGINTGADDSDPAPSYASDYPGVVQIYGVFNSLTNEYISAYEEIALYPDGGRVVINDAKTIVWDEMANRFTGMLSYHPEWMTSLKNDLITFKEGVPYIHNQRQQGGRCKFYGVQHPWYIKMVFNDKFAIKKTFTVIDLMANQVIPATEILTSIINPAVTSNPSQESNIIAEDYQWKEGHWHAAILRDLNSPGGIINGDTMKGGYLILTLRVESAQNLISLYSAGIGYIISQKNNE